MSRIVRFFATNRFCRDRSGNTAIIFGLSAIPAFTLVGAAVDYSKAFNMQTFLQNLLDAGTMASVREYGNTGDAAKAENRLRDYVLAGLQQRYSSQLKFRCWKGGDGEDAYEYTDNASVTTNATCAASQPNGVGATSIILEDTAIDSQGAMAPKISMNFPTSALSLVGAQFIKVQALSSAVLAGKNLELSVMLDTTGSMSEYAGSMTKLAGLKLAANDLLDVFKTGLQTGATRIAIVPFAQGVNPGSYASAVRGSPASSKSFTSRSYNWYSGTYSTYTYQKSPCVAGRENGDALTDNTPTGSPFTTIYTSNGSCAEGSSILPLTSNKTDLQNKINGLSANGSTPGHLGTQWAWYMLSPKWSSIWPAASTPVAYDDKKTFKAAILMTDGEYNLEYCQGVDDSVINCNDPNGSSNSQALQFCTKMKDLGITVYTVGFGMDNSTAIQLLKDCASTDPQNPTKKFYYFPYNSDEIRAAFQDIGQQLAGGMIGVKMTN